MQICYLSHGASSKLLFDEVSEHVVIKSVSSRTQILHCFYSQKSLKNRSQIDLKSFRKWYATPDRFSDQFFPVSAWAQGSLCAVLLRESEGVVACAPRGRQFISSCFYKCTKGSADILRPLSRKHVQSPKTLTGRAVLNIFSNILVQLN